MTTCQDELWADDRSSPEFSYTSALKGYSSDCTVRVVPDIFLVNRKTVLLIEAIDFFGGSLGPDDVNLQDFMPNPR